MGTPRSPQGKHWRVYAEGREFGIDFVTLTAARRAMDTYQRNFPHVHYYIRCHPGPALALMEASR